jgi:hypothetical protein
LPIPLVTTSTNPSGSDPGALGAEGTRILIGDQDIDTRTRHGARFTGGLWLNDARTLGVESSYFFIASETVSQSVASSGEANSAILAVPFFNADDGRESVFLRAIPGFVSGSALLTFTSRMQGAEVNGLVNLSSRDSVRVDLLAGFRFLDLRERLAFATSALGMGPLSPVAGNSGLVFDTLDRFDTRNDFYGGQLGARAEWRRGNWLAMGTVKVALGDMFELVDRRGDYLTNVLNNPAGGTPRSFSGFGAFVQHSNLGGGHRHEFAAVPEIGVNVGYQLRRGMRLFAGYDFLYLSDVLRPGKLMDRAINFSQTVDSIAQSNNFVPGSRPAPILTGSDFWAQGINLGFELRY